jgi:hypothetical protein
VNTEEKPAKIAIIEDLGIQVRRSSKDVIFHILKNPKWLLEWFLVFLVFKLIVSGQFDFDVIKKFLK